MRAVSSWLKFLLLAHLTLLVMAAHAWTPTTGADLAGQLPAEAAMASVALAELTETDSVSAEENRLPDSPVNLSCGDEDRGEPYPVQSCRWPDAVASGRHRPAPALAQPGPWLRLPLRPPQHALAI